MMEEEGIEQQILLSPELAVVGAVYSVNGYTGHVVLKTSDLENDSGYQTASNVDSAISEHNENEFAHPYLQTLIGTKQDELTAGVNINISEENVISATDTTYSAGNGINISGQNAISVDTTVVATQQNLANEVTNRENADNALQAQIDGISASSDVVDIVGTYADLQQYDTQHLKDNDIIKVLQDETQGGATTYYRWSTSTNTFTLIGQEGPYYTKAAADSQFVPQTRTVNGKALSSNITLNASDVSAIGTSDLVQTTGSSTSQVMSQNAVTTQLNTKLNSSDYVVDTQLADSTNPVQNKVINNLLGNMPADFFTAGETVSGEGTDITLNNTLSAPNKSVGLYGDTFQQTYSGKNILVGNYQSGTNRGIAYSWDNVFVTLSGTTTSTYSDIVDQINMSLSEGTYTFSINKPVQFRVCFRILYGGSNHDVRIQQGSTSATATIPSGVTDALLVRPYIDEVSVGTVISETFGIMLEVGSTASPFEPYVGGVPSPNPDYPQEVQTVTGEQTVTVTGDGGASQSYTIDLGSTELCKIGDYQDYIYKSGDDWYVHKAVGKVVLDGSENWGYAGSGTQTRLYTTLSDIALQPYSASVPIVTVSNAFTGTNWYQFYTTPINNVMCSHDSSHMLIVRATQFADASAFETWLSTHNTTVYYALATPTDTQITDATLIGQLEALYNAQTYLGTTNLLATATGTNLPVILDIVAYRKGLAGMLGSIGRLSE